MSLPEFFHHQTVVNWPFNCQPKTTTASTAPPPPIYVVPTPWSEVPGPGILHRASLPSCASMDFSLQTPDRKTGETTRQLTIHPKPEMSPPSIKGIIIGGFNTPHNGDWDCDLEVCKPVSLDLQKMLGKGQTYSPKWWFAGDLNTIVQSKNSPLNKSK